MNRICLRNFDNRKGNIDKNRMMIAKGLLNICGVTEIFDTPNGTRVFTVENIPDNVPCADIFWEVYEGFINNPNIVPTE